MSKQFFFLPVSENELDEGGHGIGNLKRLKTFTERSCQKKITGTTRPTGVYSETVYIDCCCSSAWPNKAVSGFFSVNNKSHENTVCDWRAHEKKFPEPRRRRKMELNKKRKTRSKRHIVQLSPCGGKNFKRREEENFCDFFFHSR